jgi:hypothetical protein
MHANHCQADYGLILTHAAEVRVTARMRRQSDIWERCFCGGGLANADFHAPGFIDPGNWQYSRTGDSIRHVVPGREDPRLSAADRVFIRKARRIQIAQFIAQTVGFHRSIHHI